MNHDDLASFKRWFSSYCSSFHTSDEEYNTNLALKEKHTANVCANVLSIVRDESLLSGTDTLIAETIALLHDVGRFPQYAEYKTFRDSISVNHGELGAQVLARLGILKDLSEYEREIITTAVRFHNAFSVPDLTCSDAIIFLKLVRDADKLDIWRVFFEYYSEDTSRDRPSAVGLDFPDAHEYSGKVLDCIFNKQLVSLAMLKTLNDFKLTKLSWVYDLNFSSSLRRAVKEGYIDRIAATLPQTDEIRRAIEFVHEYIQKKVNSEW